VIIMQVFERYVSPHEFLAFACEILLISGSLVFVFFLLQEPHAGSAALSGKVLLAAGLCQLSLYYHGFYDLRLAPSLRDQLLQLIQAAGATCVVLGLLYLLVPAVALQSRGVLVALGLLTFMVFCWRLILNRLMRTSQLIENVLVVGTGVAPRAVAHELTERHPWSHRVIGFVGDIAGAEDEHGGLPRLGGVRDILAVVESAHIDRIVVGLPEGRVRLPVRQLVNAKMSGIAVEDASAAYERLTGQLLLEELKLSKMVFAERFDVSRRRRLVKRAWDLTFSTIGLLLAAPLFAFTALAVWATSGRPVLYCQERVGQNGRVFTLYKFRSMRRDAETAGPVWASAEDGRITPVGRFIRRTRLDELPQLWNVLKGDMSFVGPRPERPVFVQALARENAFYHLRHAVKPGITGWAQVRYRYADSIESAFEKLRYDLYYIKHLSVAFDLTIVVDTVKTILFRVGSH
jgi:sugar transferase (PEP-CTERM system associated)